MIDKELIALLKQGDHSAFTEIYDRYGIVVYYKVNQMLRDEIASKDVVQDIFTKLWSQPDYIWDDANIAGYLYIAARNSVLKLIQKGKTKSDYLTELGKYSVNIRCETLEAFDEKELMMIVLSEIDKLPTRMRQIFQLSRLENLTHKEIAQQLNISESTVRKQIQYALRVLKSRLSEYSSYSILLLALYRDI